MIKSVKIKPIREYKVFEQLSTIFKHININKVSQGQILKVATYNIYLLYDNKEHGDFDGKILSILNKNSLRVNPWKPKETKKEQYH